MVQLIPCEFFQILQNSIFVEQLPVNTFRDNINLKNPASLFCFSLTSVKVFDRIKPIKFHGKDLRRVQYSMQKEPQEVICKENVLTKFETCNFNKKETPIQVSSCEFYEFFFVNHLWWLLLSMIQTSLFLSDTNKQFCEN